MVMADDIVCNSQRCSTGRTVSPGSVESRRPTVELYACRQHDRQHTLQTVFMTHNGCRIRDCKYTRVQ